MVVGRPGLSQTKTNSARAEAGARAELGNMVEYFLQNYFCFGGFRTRPRQFGMIFVCCGQGGKFFAGGVVRGVGVENFVTNLFSAF